MKKLYILFVLLGLQLNAQVINFPDANFKAKLMTSNEVLGIALNQQGVPIKIDANNDGEIDQQEALQVYRLDLGQGFITNLTGLVYFSNIKYFSLTGQFTTVNLVGLTNLETLLLYGGQMTSLTLGNMPVLKELNITHQQLTGIDLSGLPMLETLVCPDNDLIALDVSNNPQLKYLYCYFNLIQGMLDLSHNPLLKDLGCYGNSITGINITGLTQLETFYCSNNQITTLDLSGNPHPMAFLANNNQLTSLTLGGNTFYDFKCSNNLLTQLDFSSSNTIVGGGNYVIDVSNNLLTSLNLKNGKGDWLVNISINPYLKYICTDEEEEAYINLIVPESQQVSVNSYCSFNPGGINYTLNGNSKFDSANNGCDNTDLKAGSIKFAITNGTQSGNIIPDATGNYSIAVSAGTHTISPVLENPTYFNVSPASVSVTFPAQTSPQTNNFCVTPNGLHRDIDINVIPTTSAVPGFDVTYKIIYRNIGNSIANGSINLTYTDALFDFVHAIPANTLLPEGLLNWNFVNLMPFETREIYFTLNLNGPMETPAVNSGDVVSLVGNATITNGADQNPNDNTMNLMQTVVNAMDPNDKTCLEGTTITPEMVGKYVHYKIRFENEGTAPAQNIVVKDMIDMAKFDITSLIPLDSNYPFTTRIDGNKVEFIFENINLPFDDTTNDGYVVFKIKTLPTLVLGDTFSNTASIYFDYNFPIITDPAVTTVAVLGVTDNEVSAFTVSPNPTSGVLNITAKNGTIVRSVAISNVLGQVIRTIKGASIQNVDTAGLQSGTYLLTIESDFGREVKKFIKN